MFQRNTLQGCTADTKGPGCHSADGAVCRLPSDTGPQTVCKTGLSKITINHQHALASLRADNGQHGERRTAAHPALDAEKYTAFRCAGFDVFRTRQPIPVLVLTFEQQ